MHTKIRNALILLAAFLATTGFAFAHAHLKTATPAIDGSVAESPKELELHFTEGLNIRFTGIVLKDPSDSKIATGQAGLKSGDDQTLVIPLSNALAVGEYGVFWHALSKDGHKSKGSYHFTVTPK